MPMEEILFEAEEAMSSGVDYLKDELKGLRTGRASTALVDHIKVDYFGTPTELRQMAQISTPEANLIVVKPFDATVIKDIDKAIQASELGITPMSDGRVIRLTLPALSGERRKQLSQKVKQLGEQTKLVIRNARRDANKRVDGAQKDGDLPEDDAKKGKDKVQDLTKKYEKTVDDVLAAKIKEIEEV